MLVLLKTKMAEHKSIILELGFDNYIQSPAVGRSGEIVIMWRDNILKLEDISISQQSIHAAVKVLFFYSWLFSAIYANTDFNTRTTLWDNLINISHTHHSE